MDDNSTPSILGLVSTVMVPSTTVPFVAKKKFVRDTSSTTKVKIAYLGENFAEWFLSGEGKIEDPISEQTLFGYGLRQPSINGPIITQLGGEAKAEVTLYEAFSLMEKQGNAQDGVLWNRGYANIFFVKDQDGVLRAVVVRWDYVGWHVLARSVEDLRGWIGGYRVFSRNCVLEPSETLAPAQA